MGKLKGMERLIYMRFLPVDFTEVIEQRRSIRKYLNKSVPSDIIKKILIAAQKAPSWAHKQGARVMVVEDPEKMEQLRDAIGQKWVENVPMFIVVFIDPEQSGIAPNKMEYYPVDATIVMEHIILAATNEGLGTCWIGWFDEEQVKKTLSIPLKYRVIGITPLGYPEKQPGPKERHKLKDFCYLDRYGNPLKFDDSL